MSRPRKPRSLKGLLKTLDALKALNESLEPQRRLVLVRAALETDFRALGLRTKRDFRYRLAEENGISGRTLERWIARYLASGKNASVLKKKKPGPQRGWKEKGVKADVETQQR